MMNKQATMGGIGSEALKQGEVLRLRRFTTPTVYNGWEQISRQDRRTVVNREDVRDFMPQFGPMVGYAVTLVVQPSRPEHIENDPDAPARYREYVESLPGPKILVLQDLDAPNVIGTYVGEVNSSLHRALGCVGIITDGGVRDIDEMASIGFRAIASRLCVGHAYAWPVRWGCDVEVFGCTIKSGQLVHADKHGFLAIPDEDQKAVFEATLFMDGNECDTVIESSQILRGENTAQIRARQLEAEKRFGLAARQRFDRKGEWSAS
jgi:regulator of RNase E activity RraA